MGGSDAPAARQEFELAEGMKPVVVVAISKLDPKAVLPQPLAAREQAPRVRDALDSLLLGTSRSRRAA